jgi:hypothetical protein
MLFQVKNNVLGHLTLLCTTLFFFAAVPLQARAQSAHGANSQQLRQADLSQPIPVRIVEDPLPQPQNRLSAGPLGLLLGIGNFTYERALSPHFSFEVSPAFLYWGFSDEKLMGGGLGLGASYYFKGSAPKGFRLNAGVTPGYVSADSSGSDSESALFVSTKATLGYNFVWRSGFSLGLGAGVQYAYVGFDDFNSSFNGVLPALDFNLGFTW